MVTPTNTPPDLPLGRLRSDEKSEIILMIGTAGHVDHGKTRLVGMLTGCETDRLREEKERGLTIELGFAPCRLRGELAVGIVDVPGHERFIKNMVAGVSGIALTILVIAADDGIMPQTVEHVHIMEMLGLRRGIVALTKIDLVSPDVVQQRIVEIRAFTKGAFLEGAPIYPVSSETYEGYFEFYDGLVAAIGSIARVRREGVFRMPVERVFSCQGYGDVVSGIPVDGVVRVGDTVELIPGGQKGRVRGMQCFGRRSERGGYGQCLALNIPDFGKTRMERGQVLCAPGFLKAASIFHVLIRPTPGVDPPLANGDQVKFHTGTSEAAGRIYLMDGKTLDDARGALATVVTNHPVPAAVRDRLILRRPSPARTIAGGQIIDICPGDKRPPRKKALPRLQSIREAWADGTDEGAELDRRRMDWLLANERLTGADRDEIARSLLIPPEAVAVAIEGLVAEQSVRMLPGGRAISDAIYRGLLSALKDRLNQELTQNKALSIPVSALRQQFGFPPALWNSLQADLEADPQLAILSGKFVLRDGMAQLSAEDQKLARDLLLLFKKAGFQTPRPDELGERLRAPEPRIDRILNHLCDQGRLIRLDKHVILTRETYKVAQDMVIQTIRRQGTIDTPAFKAYIRSSRKYALAILEYMDARRITLRVGNERKLTPDYEKYTI